jgi:coenzyme F420 hydrogenase subunit delta
VLVLGCGNVLMGDDGFGPAFNKYLEEAGGLPEGVGLLDAGTGVRTVLFSLVLGERKPRHIVIVDAVDVGRKPGEVFDIDLDAIPPKKADDFSLHQLPTSNMLKELREHCGVDISVIAVQVESIPDSVRMGLAAPLVAAMAETRDAVLAKIGPARVAGE